MSKKYTVKFDREMCIGSAACVSVDPEGWVLDRSDGKSVLVNGKWDEDEGYFIKHIDEKDLDALMTAAKSCPVSAIHIFNSEGKKIV